MKTRDFYNIFGDDPLWFELQFSKAEMNTLRKAEALLGKVKKLLDDTYGVDDTVDIPQAEPWVMATLYLEEALEEAGSGLVKLPAREIHKCSYCGCTDPFIEGDDVHQGYDGYPCCPDCKGV